MAFGTFFGRVVVGWLGGVCLFFIHLFFCFFKGCHVCLFVCLLFLDVMSVCLRVRFVDYMSIVVFETLIFVKPFFLQKAGRTGGRDTNMEVMLRPG